MRDCYRESVRDSDVDEGLVPLISVSQSQIVALDANLEKEYPVSRKGDNGGYGHLRSVGPSLLVYAVATQDAVRGPRLGALRQHFSYYPWFRP
jgi:hypothetical protein